MFKGTVVVVIVSIAIIFAILSTFITWARRGTFSSTLWRAQIGQLSESLDSKKAQTAQAFAILMPILALGGIIVANASRTPDGLKVGMALLVLALVSGIITLSVYVSGSDNVGYTFGLASNVIAWVLILAAIVVTVLYNKKYLQ